ncbi:MAG: hypothetical protein AB7L84_14425, partial [Acidimicrobiia bacterium]
MPIDFAAVATLFSGQLAAQAAPMRRTFTDLARTLRALQRQIDQAERASRVLPLVNFRDGALAVRVARATAPGAQAPPGVVDDAGRGATAFVQGIGWVATAVHQELLLPNLGAVAAEVAGRIETATDRVLALQPSLFDIGRRDHTMFELPALGALGLQVASEAGVLKPGSVSTAPPSPGGPPATGTPGALPLPNLDEVADLLAGVTSALVLGLPAMTTFVAGRVTILSLAARIAVVDRLTEAEVALLGLRNRVSEAVMEAAGPAAIAERWFGHIDAVVRVDLVVITTWLPIAAGEYLQGVRVVVDSINDSTRTVVDVLDVVIGIIESITSINLLAPVNPVLATAGLPPVSLTIGDLIDAATTAIARQRALDAATALEALAVASWPFSQRDHRIWHGLAQMFAILAAHDIHTISQAPIPATITAFPDLVSRLFPPAFDAAVAGWARGTADGVRIAVAGAISETAGLAGSLDTAVRSVADEARRGLGGLEPATAMVAAARFADAALGDEERRQRREAAARAEGADADPFLHLFATAGFQVVGGLVPAYVDGLQRFLRRRALRPTPTSPHILARHGRLVGVRTARITLRAEGQATGAATATATATRLREAVGDLYLTGRRRLDE